MKIWKSGATLAAALGAVASLMTGVHAAPQAKYTALDLTALANIRYTEPLPADVKARRIRPLQLPAWLTALNGKPVTIAGYMLPFDINAGSVSEFMLTTHSTSCCFAPPTGVTEWVMVTMRGSREASATQDLITVNGTLSVGEQFDPAGYVSSVFRIVADSAGLESAHR